MSETGLSAITTFVGLWPCPNCGMCVPAAVCNEGTGFEDIDWPILGFCDDCADVDNDLIANGHFHAEPNEFQIFQRGVIEEPPDWLNSRKES